MLGLLGSGHVSRAYRDGSGQLWFFRMVRVPVHSSVILFAYGRFGSWAIWFGPTSLSWSLVQASRPETYLGCKFRFLARFDFKPLIYVISPCNSSVYSSPISAIHIAFWLYFQEGYPPISIWWYLLIFFNFSNRRLVSKNPKIIRIWRKFSIFSNFKLFQNLPFDSL